MDELQVNEDAIVLLSERPESSLNVLRSTLGETGVDDFHFVIGGGAVLVAWNCYCWAKMTLLYNNLGWNAEFIHKIHIFNYIFQSLQQRKAIAQSVQPINWHNLISIMMTPRSRSHFNLFNAYLKSLFFMRIEVFSLCSLLNTRRNRRRCFSFSGRWRGSTCSVKLLFFGENDFLIQQFRLEDWIHSQSPYFYLQFSFFPGKESYSIK